MDDIVKAALKKWPNVPDCRGWLALDARGNWYMRDDRIQAAGPFPRIKGSRIEHEKLREFIHRQLRRRRGRGLVLPEWPAAGLCGAGGRAVGVAAHSGNAAGAVLMHSHSGLPAQFKSAWVDEAGRLFIATDLGLGLVHTQDMGSAADQVERGTWPIGELPFSEMPARFGYRLSPQADEAAAVATGHEGPGSSNAVQAP